MDISNFLLLLICTLFCYYLGLRKAYSIARTQDGIKSLNSMPQYYGIFVSICFLLPALVIILFWLLISDFVITQLIVNSVDETNRPSTDNQINLLINKLANWNPNSGGDETFFALAHYYHKLILYDQQLLLGTSLGIATLSTVFSYITLAKINNIRQLVERIIRYIFMFCAAIAIFTTIGIVLSVLFESIRFFNLIPITDFLFGTHWSPQASIRADQIASSGSFGSVPLFVGTLQISFLAMLIAVPLGLMSAIYLSEYASDKARNIIKPILEILAGIPTVVYGFFAALSLGPFLRETTEYFGLTASSESLLAAGIIMGIMIIPFISSLSDDVINAVPQSLRDGSLALGATHSETIKKVILPAALPGVASSILLAFSRAIGETMIVVMAAGLAANLTLNPLESVTTVTVQIVTLLVGDQEFDSAKTLAAFALGLVLFIVTLILNIIALQVVRRYKEQYE